MTINGARIGVAEERCVLERGDRARRRGNKGERVRDTGEMDKGSGGGEGSVEQIKGTEKRGDGDMVGEGSPRIDDDEEGVEEEEEGEESERGERGDRRGDT